MSRLPTAWSAFLLGVVGCVGGTAPAPKPLNPVRFLSINDVHVADDHADSGGVARVATARNRIAVEGTVLFVVAGNFLGAGNGQAMIHAMNAAKVDYVTFGNEELQLDRDTLLARIAKSSFKWISSNCTLTGAGTVAGKLLRWDTVRVATHKVGIFGLTMAGPHADYARCGDPDSAARQAVEALAAQDVELIVAVTHQPVDADRDLLLRESRIDLILGGHENQAQTAVISGRYVLKADGDARSAQFVTLWGGKGEWRQAVGLIPIDSRLPADTAVARAANTNPG